MYLDLAVVERAQYLIERRALSPSSAAAIWETEADRD